LSSGLPNNIAGVFGTKLYAQPSWLPVMEFPWWIFFGTLVTFLVAIVFKTSHQQLAINKIGSGASAASGAAN
jgi:hypothetical protein